MGTGSTLARVLPALRVLPVLPSCSPPLRNGKAAGRSMLALVALIMAVPLAPRLSLYFCRYPMPKSTCVFAKSTCT
eukprot:1525129-Prymnesium_polylepis.3